MYTQMFVSDVIVVGAIKLTPDTPLVTVCAFFCVSPFIGSLCEGVVTFPPVLWFPEKT